MSLGKKTFELCFNKGLFLYSAGGFLGAILAVLTPFLLGLFIDSIVYGGRSCLLFILLSGNALLTWLLELHLKNFITQIARSKELQIQYRMLEIFQRMKPSAVDRCGNGEITMKFYRDAGMIEQLIANFYPIFINMFFNFVFAFLLVLWKKPLIAGIFLFFLPCLLIVSKKYSDKLTKITHLIRILYDHSVNNIFEFIHIFPFLKSMSADVPYFTFPESKFSRYRKLNLISDITGIQLDFFNRFLLLAGEYSVLGVSCYMAWKGKIRIGDVVMFQTLFLSVFRSFSGMFQLLPNWKAAQESINSVYELLNTPDTEDIACNPVIPTALSDLSAEHLSFSYPNSAEKIFDDFSCKIKAGSIVALTGVNGSGKTTLLKLLTGYLLPDKGCVKIAGRNLCSWQIKSFRERISYVFQDSLLFSGTIRDNITLKNMQYTDSDISHALQLSGADQIVARLSEGLDCCIAHDRSGLSGGERQKIAIARALIRHPEILIFDEVTNHLDYQSRIKIRDLIKSLRGKTTIFMVSHDPELVKLCDYEINLDNRKVKND